MIQIPKPKVLKDIANTINSASDDERVSYYVSSIIAESCSIMLAAAERGDMCVDLEARPEIIRILVASGKLRERVTHLLKSEFRIYGFAVSNTDIVVSWAEAI